MLNFSIWSLVVERLSDLEQENESLNNLLQCLPIGEVWKMFLPCSSPL